MIILGLGCNIGDRLANLRQALKYLHSVNELHIEQVSPVYESDAMLPENAPLEWNMPYLNAALLCKTKLTAEELLPKLKAIEIRMGRAEHLHWSPRYIDIDILAWNEECYRSEKLHIPHRGLIERPFALWPLADVAPDWKYCLPNTNVTGQTAKTIVRKWGSRFTAESPFHTHQIAHRIDTPLMMGILNITPDSYSDGNNFMDIQAAMNHADHLFESGSDIIDIGAESTRPRADNLTITPQEEWQRLQPFLENLFAHWQEKKFRPKISIDTRNAETAQKILQFPIDFINDVTGFTNPQMCEIALKYEKIKLIYMHNMGIPASHKDGILDENKDACEQVYNWAEQQLTKLTQMGIEKNRLIFDPGIGFGKSAAQSFTLIKNIDKFKSLDLPILVGHSRKSFLNLFTDKPFAERDLETAIIADFLTKHHIDYLRVHNVDATIRLLKISAALDNAVV